MEDQDDEAYEIAYFVNTNRTAAGIVDADNKFLTHWQGSSVCRKTEYHFLGGSNGNKGMPAGSTAQKIEDRTAWRKNPEQRMTFASEDGEIFFLKRIHSNHAGKRMVHAYMTKKSRCERNGVALLMKGSEIHGGLLRRTPSDAGDWNLVGMVYHCNNQGDDRLS